MESKFRTINEHTFETLVKEYLSSVFRFVLRMVRDEHDAHDVTQDAFLKVWRYRKKFRGGEDPKVWIFSIAHNAALDFLRKKKPLVFSEFETEEGNVIEDTLEATEPTAEEVFDRAASAATLERILVQISVQSREVLLLHYFDDLTFDEIGRVLGKPLNTVKSQHRRALLALKKLLGR